MSATRVEQVSIPKHFAELQFTGIEPATLVTGPKYNPQFFNFILYISQPSDHNLLEFLLHVTHFILESLSEQHHLSRTPIC